MAFATEQDYYNALAIIAFYLLANKKDAVLLLNKNGVAISQDAPMETLNAAFLAAMGSSDVFLSQASDAIKQYAQSAGELKLPDLSGYYNAVGTTIGSTVISAATNLISAGAVSNQLTAEANAIAQNQQQVVAQIEATAEAKAAAASQQAVQNANSPGWQVPWPYIIIAALLVAAAVVVKREQK